LYSPLSKNSSRNSRHSKNRPCTSEAVIRGSTLFAFVRTVKHLFRSSLHKDHFLPDNEGVRRVLLGLSLFLPRKQGAFSTFPVIVIPSLF
jgi:hypothetical protein